MNEKEMKNWIDKANYQELLRKWRYKPTGSPWFSGDVGKYYAAAMDKKKAETPLGERVRASKAIDRDRVSPRPPAENGVSVPFAAMGQADKDGPDLAVIVDGKAACAANTINRDSGAAFRAGGNHVAACREGPLTFPQIVDRLGEFVLLFTCWHALRYNAGRGRCRGGKKLRRGVSWP